MVFLHFILPDLYVSCRLNDMSSFGIPHTAIWSQLGQSLYTNFPNCVNFPYICAHLPTIQPASVSPDLQLGHITPFKCLGTKRAHLHQKSSFCNWVTLTQLQENMLMRSRDQNTQRSLADKMNPTNLTLIFEVKHLSSSSYISTTSDVYFHKNIYNIALQTKLSSSWKFFNLHERNSQCNKSFF